MIELSKIAQKIQRHTKKRRHPSMFLAPHERKYVEMRVQAAGSGVDRRSLRTKLQREYLSKKVKQVDEMLAEARGMKFSNESLKGAILTKIASQAQAEWDMLKTALSRLFIQKGIRTGIAQRGFPHLAEQAAARLPVAEGKQLGYVRRISGASKPGEKMEGNLKRLFASRTSGGGRAKGRQRATFIR